MDAMEEISRRVLSRFNINSDNLWKKESTDDGEMYIDIMNFDHPNNVWKQMHDTFTYKHQFLNRKYDAKKDNDISTKLRYAGNKQTDKKRYRAAMEYYNQSLRFAVPDTENVGWVYHNRALCFLNTDKPEQCLQDIKMSKVNKLPGRFSRESNRRKDNATKNLKNLKPKEEKTLKIGFPPDKTFPEMANVLEIKCNEKYGRHIVAVRDIDIGEIVLVEKPFATIFDMTDRTWCFTCLKPEQNFIPCPNCVDVMFCDEKCMEMNKIHELSCGSGYHRIEKVKPLRLLTQTILKVLIIFDTFEELKEFVETELTKPKDDLPDPLDDKSKYAMFLRLHYNAKKDDVEAIGQLSFVYHFIMEIESLNQRFDTIDKKRFLMHLIWQHHLICKNAHLALFPQSEGFVYGLGLIHSLFNHSCVPNVHHQFYNDKIVCTTVSRIKKGQQLFVMYMDNSWGLDQTTRQALLYKQYNFNCNCRRCSTKPRQSDSEQMQLFDESADSFAFVTTQSFTPASHKFLCIKAHCFRFMERFGHLSCTEELMRTLFQLTICLHKSNPEYYKIPLHSKI